jgi:hypothetical protein
MSSRASGTQSRSSILDLTEEIDTGKLCVIATRGAQSGNRLSLIPLPKKSVVYLWPQNDEPGQIWLAKNLPQLEGAYVVEVPKPHKDFGDWAKGGNAQPVDLEAAMQNADFQKGETSSDGKAEDAETEQNKAAQASWGTV